MTTQEIIDEILRQLNYSDGHSYAVIHKISLLDPFEEIDWWMISIFFNTNEIHGYTMTDKVVIDLKPTTTTL